MAEAARTREQLLAVDADVEALAPCARRRRGGRARAAELRAANEWAFTAGELPAVRMRREAEAELADAQRDVDQTDARVPTRSTRDLAQVRAELAEVDAERATIEPNRAEADEVERAAAELRAEVDAQLGVAPELTDESRALRAAEEAVQRADAEWREARAPTRRAGGRAPRRSRSRSTKRTPSAATRPRSTA